MTLNRGYYPEQKPKPEDLISSELQTVRKIAYYFHGRVKGAVEADDLIQVGYLGLIDASQKYVKKPGVTFTSYAKIRIRGAIVDYLRRSSNLCRTTIAMKQGLRKQLSKLSEREALVMQLYYVEELNVYEIAKILEVTTGRVSQIKKSAIGNLRDGMTAFLSEN